MNLVWRRSERNEAPELVHVTELRRGGKAKLSNGWIVDEDGFAEGTSRQPGGTVAPCLVVCVAEESNVEAAALELEKSIVSARERLFQPIQDCAVELGNIEAAYGAIYEILALTSLQGFDDWASFVEEAVSECIADIRRQQGEK